jgi:hypothetical protein
MEEWVQIVESEGSYVVKPMNSEVCVWVDEKNGGAGEGARRRIAIEPHDTKQTLKRKRNGGVCEYQGCCETEGVEWHHDLPSIEDIRAGKKRRGVYRNPSNYQPTSNRNVLAAYEYEMQLCTLLCKRHHELVHTQWLDALQNSRLDHLAILATQEYRQRRRRLQGQEGEEGEGEGELQVRAASRASVWR